MNVPPKSAHSALKRFCEITATLAAFPAAVAYLLSGMLLTKYRVFPGFSQAFSLLPGFSGIYLRRAFYRQVLPQCGAESCISFGTIFSHATVRIGYKVYIGIGCMIGDVTLEDDVLVGSHVSIINGNRQHGISRLDIPVREQPGHYPRIKIGEDSWIGDRAIVMADVGKHCVVGAGSVVTKPVPDCAIVVGNPARILGFRNQSQGETKSCAPALPRQPLPGGSLSITDVKTT
jgi:acetyltransferase-like isoleucine patch superfamily enzyme